MFINHSTIYSTIVDVSDEQCSDDKFTCNNKNCIELSLTCNNNEDCGDNSDEDDCICMYCSIKLNDQLDSLP